MGDDELTLTDDYSMIDGLDLPDDGSFVLEDEAAVDHDMQAAGMPEPPSIDELDLDIAQGSALQTEMPTNASFQAEIPAETPRTGSSNWKDQILFSEDMPADEPEIEEIDDLLGLGEADSSYGGDDLVPSLDDEPVALTPEEPDEILSDHDLPDILDEDSEGDTVDGVEALNKPSDDDDEIALPELGGFDDPASDTAAAEPIAPPKDEEFDLIEEEPISFEKEMSGAPTSKDFFSDDDDDEEVLLSDEELEDIGSGPKADNLELIDDDLDSSLSEPVQPDETKLSTAAVDNDFFADSDDDEPITLTADELDGIVEDASFEEPEKSEKPEELKEPHDEISSTVADDFFNDTDDEGPITLSTDELDNILGDAAVEEPVPSESTEMALEHDEAQPPLQIEDAPDEPALAQLSSFEDDDDQNITLSEDELGGILEDSDLITEGDPQIIDESIGGPKDSDDESAAAPEVSAVEDDFFNDEAEEGPITLSDEELDGILADASEAPADDSDINEDVLEPVEAIQPIDSPDTVTFAEDLGETSPQNVDDKLEAIEAAADGALPPRDELRKMISYLDNLLGELPDDTIAKFAESEYFKLYQKVMEQLEL